MFRLLNACAATVAIVGTLSLPVGIAHGADSTAGKMKDLKDFSCKDIMRLSGEDREVALAIAHGYVLGKKGKTQYSIDALAQITDKFLDHCLDNPKDNALSSFEKMAK